MIPMIDPKNITNYNSTISELETHILFWVFAAGHNALSTAKGLEKFLTSVREAAKPFIFYHSPFGTIYVVGKFIGWNSISELLRNSGLGCWRRKTRTIKELAESSLDLKTCSISDLMAIYGIGPKTASCFILHTRKGVRMAGLDTHILKFLRDKGIDVPKSTPTGKKYEILEKEFLRLCDEAGKTPAEYDLMIWKQYAKY